MGATGPADPLVVYRHIPDLENALLEDIYLGYLGPSTWRDAYLNSPPWSL